MELRDSRADLAAGGRGSVAENEIGIELRRPCGWRGVRGRGAPRFGDAVPDGYERGEQTSAAEERTNGGKRLPQLNQRFHDLPRSTWWSARRPAVPDRVAELLAPGLSPAETPGTGTRGLGSPRRAPCSRLA